MDIWVGHTLEPAAEPHQQFSQAQLSSQWLAAVGVRAQAGLAVLAARHQLDRVGPGLEEPLVERRSPPEPVEFLVLAGAAS